MFRLFLFLSLAIVKRCSEIVVRHAAGKTGLAGRGYRIEDMGVLLPLGRGRGVSALNGHVTAFKELEPVRHLGVGQEVIDHRRPHI